MNNNEAKQKILMFFSPYFVVVLAFLWGNTELTNWPEMLSSLLRYCLLLCPILIAKHFSQQTTKPSKQLIWWLTAFAVVPFVHFILWQNNASYAAQFSIGLSFFFALWLVEALLLINKVTKPWALSGLKQRLTMDNIIFTLLLLISVFWSLVFNSIDNPIENQPIHILIDLKRNLLRFDEFLGYFVQFFLIYCCGYLLYWVNHHWLINRVMARFGILNYLWIATGFTLLATPLLSQLALLLPLNSGEFTLLPSGNDDPFDSWNLRIAFMIMFVSLPLILAFKWQQQTAELAVLQHQSTQTELKWLQQQINPHFLFNTLNNLYAMTLAKSNQAPQAILQLANLLRFVVYQGGKSRVSLTQELTYLQDYIALQQLRVSHKTDIDVDFNNAQTDAEQVFIAPLLLIVLIENAFKHGIDASDQRSWLRIRIELQQHRLTFSCHNSVDQRVKPNSTELDGGVGLDNLRRRLALIYPDRHQLSTTSQDGEFGAELTLQLDDNKA